MVRRSSFAGSMCPIARSLDLVGKWWTFLILRNVLLGGPSRFDDLQRSLGISPNVLSTRLARLVEEGVLTRRPYSERPPRHEYVATVKGQELLPVLVSLAAWGSRWVEEEPAVGTLLHHDHALEPELRCACCQEPVGQENLRSQPPG